ncbi:High mobility group box domain, partial [Trinorchestia longiramus]
VTCTGGCSQCPPVKRRGGWPKGRKRKPEIPGAKPPKAPQTAYVLFLADRRKFYDPREYTFGEITKRVAMEWNSLPQTQRDVYERRCEQEKNRYRNELQAYRQSHDFQLIMRKKRLKRALSGGNPEDSSDCTDGPE